MPFIEKNAPQFRVEVLGNDPALQFVAQQIGEVLPKLTGAKQAAPQTAWSLKLALNHDVLKAQDLSREKLGDDGFLIVRDKAGVLLTGYTPRAILYGAFFVLEKATGFMDVRPQSGFVPVEPI